MKNARSNAKPSLPGACVNELPHGLSHYGSGTPATQALTAAAIPDSWDELEYRQGVVEAEVHLGIAWQIRVNREERGMSQSDFAVKIGTRQSAISRLEDPQGNDLRISTLVRVAHAFDCALMVRLVPFSEFAASTQDTRTERLLVCGYGDDVTAGKTSKVSAARSGNALSYEFKT